MLPRSKCFALAKNRATQNVRGGVSNPAPLGGALLESDEVAIPVTLGEDHSIYTQLLSRVSRIKYTASKLIAAANET